MNEASDPPSALPVRRRRKNLVTSRVVLKYREDGSVTVHGFASSAGRIGELALLVSGRAIGTLPVSEVSQDGPASEDRAAEQAPPIAATEIQFADVSEFLEAKAQRIPQAWTLDRAVAVCYRAWAAERELAVLGPRGFRAAMTAAGLRLMCGRPGRSDRALRWLGVRMMDAAPEVEPADLAVLQQTLRVKVTAMRLEHVDEFMTARLERAFQFWTPGRELWACYLCWVAERQLPALGRHALGVGLRAAGLRTSRARRDANGKQVRTWEGARLRIEKPIQSDTTGASQLSLVEG
jgi:hypothetical protein